MEPSCTVLKTKLASPGHMNKRDTQITNRFAFSEEIAELDSRTDHTWLAETANRSTKTLGRFGPDTHRSYKEHSS